MLTTDEIGGRVAQEIGAGMVVNLGIGMGGDIDPSLAARRLAILTTHRDCGGGRGPKLVRRCTPPLTAGFELVEVGPCVHVEEARAEMGAALQVSPQPGVADARADPAPATEGGRV